jgi:hypothetical protein
MVADKKKVHLLCRAAFFLVAAYAWYPSFLKKKNYEPGAVS